MNAPIPAAPAGKAEFDFIQGPVRVSAREDVGADGRWYVLYRSVAGKTTDILFQTREWRECYYGGQALAFLVTQGAAGQGTVLLSRYAARNARWN